VASVPWMVIRWAGWSGGRGAGDQSTCRFCVDDRLLEESVGADIGSDGPIVWRGALARRWSFEHLLAGFRIGIHV